MSVKLSPDDLPFVWGGIYRSPVASPHKGFETRSKPDRSLTIASISNGIHGLINKRSPVTFIRGQFQNICPSHQLPKLAWKLHFDSNLPGAKELMWIYVNISMTLLKSGSRRQIFITGGIVVCHITCVSICDDNVGNARFSLTGGETNLSDVHCITRIPGLVEQVLNLTFFEKYLPNCIGHQHPKRRVASF